MLGHHFIYFDINGEEHPGNMLYHIFNPTVYFPLWWFFWMIWMLLRRDDEWIIRDSVREKILYSTTHVSKSGTQVKSLYRGPSTSGDLIATIESISKDVWFIHPHSQSRGWYFRTPCFDFDDDTFCWKGKYKVTNLTGTTIVRLDTASWQYTKVGDMTMVDMDEHLREVVLETMVAMDWSQAIAASEEAARLEVCRLICEEERNKGCEGRTVDGNKLQQQGQRA
jgi:hypothetical protein